MKYLVLLTSISLSLLASSTLHLKETNRYFGGLSEVKANVPESIMLTPSTLMTEEIFSAKDTNEVEVAVMKQKQQQVENGIKAKDFAMENTGHLYGGLSNGKLDFK